MTLVDAHCHLDFGAFDADRREVVERARQAGVTKFIVPGTTRAAWPDVLAMRDEPGMSVCLGLHPYFMQEHQDADVEVLDDTLERCPDVVALGECGVDGRFSATLEAQWRLFDAQVRLARRRQLPLVVHCVHVNDRLAKRLRQLSPGCGGLIHAFSGSLEQALAFYRQGFLLGIGGASTYPRAKRLRRAVAGLPRDSYVLETDSPDMPLCGHQGQRNEPMRIAEVCRVVAEIRQEPVEQVALDSTSNAKRLFGLASGD